MSNKSNYSSAPGAHLMDFGSIMSGIDGIIYLPTPPRGHPGVIGKPFMIRYKECFYAPNRIEVIVGAMASMCMRKVAVATFK